MLTIRSVSFGECLAAIRSSAAFAGIPRSRPWAGARGDSRAAARRVRTIGWSLMGLGCGGGAPRGGSVRILPVPLLAYVRFMPHLFSVIMKNSPPRSFGRGNQTPHSYRATSAPRSCRHASRKGRVVSPRTDGASSAPVRLWPLAGLREIAVAGVRLPGLVPRLRQVAEVGGLPGSVEVSYLGRLAPGEQQGGEQSQRRDDEGLAQGDACVVVKRRSRRTVPYSRGFSKITRSPGCTTPVRES